MGVEQFFLALLIYSVAETQGQFPLPFNATVLQGDRATCPNPQAVGDISSNVESLLRDQVLPLLPTSVPQCACMPRGRRIAYLDMNNPSHQCPQGWRLIESPRRLCGRDSTGASCQSVIYSANGESYQHVCGRIVAYQFCDTGAFNQLHYNPAITIDSYYVDGISITHGSPRHHVWTFASAFQQIETGFATCFCTNTANTNDVLNLVPSYVGEDYFCDSIVTHPGPCGNPFPTDDPLWDGAGCSATSTCCVFNNPPWFCKTLPQATTDDIEVRVCGDREVTIDDTPVELIELYVS